MWTGRIRPAPKLEVVNILLECKKPRNFIFEAPEINKTPGAQCGVTSVRGVESMITFIIIDRDGYYKDIARSRINSALHPVTSCNPLSKQI